MLVKWGYDSLVRPHLTVSAATIGSTQRDSADEFEPGGLTLDGWLVGWVGEGGWLGAWSPTLSFEVNVHLPPVKRRALVQHVVHHVSGVQPRPHFRVLQRRLQA